MPPQQRQRLSDVVGDRLRLSLHAFLFAPGLRGMPRLIYESSLTASGASPASKNISPPIAAASIHLIAVRCRSIFVQVSSTQYSPPVPLAGVARTGTRAVTPCTI